MNKLDLNEAIGIEALLSLHRSKPQTSRSPPADRSKSRSPPEHDRREQPPEQSLRKQPSAQPTAVRPPAATGTPTRHPRQPSTTEQNLHPPQTPPPTQPRASPPSLPPSSAPSLPRQPPVCTTDEPSPLSTTPRPLSSPADNTTQPTTQTAPLVPSEQVIPMPVFPPEFFQPKSSLPTNPNFLASTPLTVPLPTITIPPGATIQRLSNFSSNALPNLPRLTEEPVTNSAVAKPMEPSPPSHVAFRLQSIPSPPMMPTLPNPSQLPVPPPPLHFPTTAIEDSMIRNRLESTPDVQKERPQMDEDGDVKLNLVPIDMLRDVIGTNGTFPSVAIMGGQTSQTIPNPPFSFAQKPPHQFLPALPPTPVLYLPTMTLPMPGAMPAIPPTPAPADVLMPDIHEIEPPQFKNTSADEGVSDATVKSDDTTMQEVVQAVKQVKIPIPGNDPSRPFACSVPGCSKRFEKNVGLKRHIRTHKGHRPYRCSFAGCSRDFARKDRLTVHVRSAHTGEKPSCCDICGKTFACNVYLNNHRKYHENIRPHVCEKCQKGFVHKGDLNKHMRSVHQKNGRNKKKKT